MAKPSTPTCPQCHVRTVAQADWFVCPKCKGMFDDDPDEGGDFSDRDPSARLERQERRRVPRSIHGRPRR